MTEQAKAMIEGGARAAAAQVAAMKPRLRGVSHKYAFFVSLVAGVVLIVAVRGSEARLAMTIYAVALSGLFGTSALYHRVDWSPTRRRWMRRLDHSMIFVLIAGTYTPFALLVLDGTLATVVLIVVWAGALSGVVMKLAWIDAPKWIVAISFVALGWVGMAALPGLVEETGVTGAMLIAGGGLLYTVGALVYALRRPDPVPTVFGYHEVFHALVIVAAALHFTAIAIYAAPAG